MVASARNLVAVWDVLGSDGEGQLRFADSDAWDGGNVPSRVLAVEWIRDPVVMAENRADMGGRLGEFGGVAAQAFHLIDGEDDAAVRGVGLDLAARLQRTRLST